MKTGLRNFTFIVEMDGDFTVPFNARHRLDYDFPRHG
jgi:hypothetical protein